MQAAKPHRGASATSATVGLRLLIVEDEPEVARDMSRNLAARGHQLKVVGDGLAALRAGCYDEFDVMIVDRLLPGMDGLSVVRALRARGVGTPALLVTALGAVAHRIDGLEGGADDYLVKPFDFDELHARVKALGRRASNARHEPTRLQYEDLVMDRLARTVRRGDREIELLPLEYRLLEVLLLNAGEPITRMMLLEQVWGLHFDPRTNIVETHISRMRGKLDPDGTEPLIRTRRGIGYLIGPAPPTSP
ncbi:response regulator transcription factor [Phenylobacterium sp.]|uniref:response regulator transcription factor n=1 Tax=Phenylobacterium sp. TaxID=1871053 RepID=UPI0012242BF0|nr:response regulator transcription factor [Phenylobacterium sp.]THD57311.1 MAG: response regulator transcription factor [Phenylobacterium sp.]